MSLLLTGEGMMMSTRTDNSSTARDVRTSYLLIMYGALAKVYFEVQRVQNVVSALMPAALPTVKIRMIPHIRLSLSARLRA